MAAVAVRQENIETTKGRSRRRSPRSRKRSGFEKVCLLVAAMAFVLGYVGMYAQVSHTGYKRAALMEELREQRLENQSLRVSIQELTSADRLAGAAKSGGMEPGTQIVFVSAPKPVSVARADEDR